MTSHPTQSIRDYWRSFPQWKLKLVQPIHRTVYSAAVGMSDEEILDVVREALRRARKDLSS